MEHIVQFGISIDDDKISKSIHESAQREITKNIQQMVCDRLFGSHYCNCHADPKCDPLSYFTEDIVKEFLTDNKDVIIGRVAHELADRMMKSKVMKDKILTQVIEK